VQPPSAAEEAVVVERALHDGFMRDAVSAAQFEATPLSPVCHHYVHYLQSMGWSRSYLAAGRTAALLLDHAEVGRRHPGRSTAEQSLPELGRYLRR
jgi:thiaminase/transcriptional activator TenA